MSLSACLCVLYAHRSLWRPEEGVGSPVPSFLFLKLFIIIVIIIIIVVIIIIIWVCNVPPSHSD